MSIHPRDHAYACDFHLDQYPWECTCGAIKRKTMKYKTIIALHAWAWADREGGDQTYCEPDDPNVAGWNVHLQHRDPKTDDMVNPEGAIYLDADVDDYAGAYRIATVLSSMYGWEVREY